MAVLQDNGQKLAFPLKYLRQYWAHLQ